MLGDAVCKQTSRGTIPSRLSPHHHLLCNIFPAKSYSSVELKFVSLPVVYYERVRHLPDMSKEHQNSFFEIQITRYSFQSDLYTLA